MIALLLLSAALAQPTGQVTVPLDRWDAARAAAAQSPMDPDKAFVSAADHRGETDAETLAIRLVSTLEVHLEGAGYKTVPLVGADAVLLSVTVDGQPVAVGVADGYHVWHGSGAGPRRVVVESLIPPSGRRGSIEYDFRVPETLTTHLELRLPVPDLTPRVEGAVRTDVQTAGSRTVVRADLAPTHRIQLVGLKDFGQQSAAQARRYVESLDLLSVDESMLQLFCVYRYRILYAGSRQFDVFIPEEYRIVSADGQGGFRYDLTAADGGWILHGETDLPVHNTFELSLRLERELNAEAFAVQLPRALGVERERGWLGVEVPGRMRLVPEKTDGAREIGVNGLPHEVVSSAVSPILGAWRVVEPGATLQLRATELPAVEPASEAIDRVEASTVVSENGQTRTRIALSLRNQARHSIAVVIPEGGEVVRATADGETVRPARADTGELLLPLRRTGGRRAMQLEVVVDGQVDLDGWTSDIDLLLPTFDLPVSSLQWRVHLPDGSRWGGLRGDVPTAPLKGSGSWYGTDQGSGEVAPGSAETRLEPPDGSVSRDYERYWLPSEAAVSLQVRRVSLPFLH